MAITSSVCPLRAQSFLPRVWLVFVWERARLIGGLLDIQPLVASRRLISGGSWMLGHGKTPCGDDCPLRLPEQALRFLRAWTKGELVSQPCQRGACHEGRIPAAGHWLIIGRVPEMAGQRQTGGRAASLGEDGRGRGRGCGRGRSEGGRGVEMRALLAPFVLWLCGHHCSAGDDDMAVGSRVWTLDTGHWTLDSGLW
jgi:hypothetical protein